jgi:predicted NACHT family NTPase
MMTKRSLQASEDGIKKAKRVFNRKRLTQESLASQIGIDSRQPIWKFFTGKPIDRRIFNEICFFLELNPEEIVQPLDDESEAELTHQQSLKHENSDDIVTLVNKVRAAHSEKIQNQCSTLRLLDVGRIVKLDELYVDVNIVEEITSQRWLNIADLTTFENTFSAKIGKNEITGLQAIEKFSKLLVVGKPGSGKTTFLQSVAILCNYGKFEKQRIPVFISLKDFAEKIKFNDENILSKYLIQEFSYDKINAQELEKLLNEGRVIILLDGLDEVTDKHIDQVNKIIDQFSEIYYKNVIVITARIASVHYKFKGFAEVEIADFTKSQITDFAHKWFTAVAQNLPHKEPKPAAKFIEKLTLPENRLIQELATTPLLLNLTCLVFQYLGDFPNKRSEIYRQGLELLLVRWDEARGIKRDEVYRNLTLSQKIKLLSSIAAILFETGEYFFEEQKICQLIADYLCLLPHAPTDIEDLQLDSKSVLKAIEVQHGLLVEQARGIYSFSHLTFHEYFTARKFVASSEPTTLETIVNYLSEPRWREVIILTSEMLVSADYLFQLMKQQVDELAANDHTFQEFLNWVEQKSLTITTTYNPAAVRAFYFTLALPADYSLSRNQTLAITLDSHFAGKLSNDLALDLALIHSLAVTTALTPEIFCKRISALKIALDIEYLLPEHSSLGKSLQILQDELPDVNQDRKVLRLWWQTHGESWTRHLKNLLVSHRKIGYDWQFNDQHLGLIQQYWDANSLLISCLNTATNVSPQLRNFIEQSLFLPLKIEEIKEKPIQQSIE